MSPSKDRAAPTPGANSPVRSQALRPGNGCGRTSVVVRVDQAVVRDPVPHGDRPVAVVVPRRSKDLWEHFGCPPEPR
jgi:hypothetical protein